MCSLTSDRQPRQRGRAGRLRLLDSLRLSRATLIIVTHDARIAATAGRLITMRDSAFVRETRLTAARRDVSASSPGSRAEPVGRVLLICRLAARDLRRRPAEAALLLLAAAAATATLDPRPQPPRHHEPALPGPPEATAGPDIITQVDPPPDGRKRRRPRRPRGAHPCPRRHGSQQGRFRLPSGHHRRARRHGGRVPRKVAPSCRPRSISRS